MLDTAMDTVGCDALAVSKHRPADAQLINLLHFRRDAMISELHAQQEIDARDNAAHQDFTVASGKGVKFKLAQGDKVSYMGMDYVLLNTSGPDADIPIGCLLFDNENE